MTVGNAVPGQDPMISDIDNNDIAYMIASHIVGPLYTESFGATTQKVSSNDEDRVRTEGRLSS